MLAALRSGGIETGAPSSWSRDPGQAQAFTFPEDGPKYTRVILTTRTKRGVSIEEVADIKEEREVIQPPGKFRVTSLVKTTDEATGVDIWRATLEEE